MGWKARIMGLVCSVLVSLPLTYLIYFILNNIKQLQGGGIPLAVSFGVFSFVTIHSLINPAFYVGFLRGLLKLWKFGNNFPSI